MAWPDKLSKVKCTGFDKKYLPVLKHAIDNDLIKWGECKLFIDLGTGEFTFAGCRWEMTEWSETITDIRLISGKIKEQDLTAAMLKGKLESS